MSDDPSRRQFLRVAGTAASGVLAGCSTRVGSQGTGDDTGTSTSTPTSSGTRPDSVYTRVYRQVIDSVVLVQVNTPRGQGHGSGFVYRSGGYIVTNQHVVESATSVSIRFSRGEWRTAEVVGTDVYSDLAVLRVDSVPDYTEPLALVESDPPIGAKVLAIGNPYRFDKTVSAGIVSGVNRSIDVTGPLGGFQIPDAVQTDAAVNPGNSGGPLVDMDGEVVGIIRSGGGENIGFAVSAALIRRVVPELIEDGTYEHPYMGVSLQTVTPAMAEAIGLERVRGIMVVRVREGAPADGVLQPATGSEIVDGMRVPVGGDVIVALDGNRIDTYNELSTHIALNKRPGETMRITVIRDGSRETVELTLGERPEPGR